MITAMIWVWDTSHIVLLWAIVLLVRVVEDSEEEEEQYEEGVFTTALLAGGTNTGCSCEVSATTPAVPCSCFCFMVWFRCS